MNFADGKWKHGSSVKEVAATITNGVQGTAMMPFKTRFSEQEILALAKYVRAFDKSSGVCAGQGEGAGQEEAQPSDSLTADWRLRLAHPSTN